MKQTTFLEASELSISNNGTPLFKSLNFSLTKGSIVAVIGENGSGKSTLLDHLAGIKKALGGKVLMQGIDINTLTAPHRCKLIASIGQNDHSCDDIMVNDRIAQGLTPRFGTHFYLSPQIRALVKQAAHLTQVDHLLSRPLGTLSGGERKRVNIARCIVDDEALIYILDEPFAGIDLRHQQKLCDTLMSLANAQKTGHYFVA